MTVKKLTSYPGTMFSLVAGTSLERAFHFDKPDRFSALLDADKHVTADEVKSAVMQIKDRDDAFDLIANAVNLARKNKKDALTRESVNQMIQDATDKMRETQRKDIYSRTDNKAGGDERGRHSYKSLILDRPNMRDADVKDLQRLNDDLLLLALCINAKRITEQLPPIAVTELNLYKQWQGETARYKAMDTQTSAEGAEWLPTAFSANMIEQIRFSTEIVQLFPVVTIPRAAGSIKLPKAGADPTVKWVAEETADTGTKFPVSTPGTGNVELVPKKFVVRVLFSTESEEDLILPVLDYIRNQKIIPTIAEAMEDAALNGDATGGHVDADVTASDDVRKAYDGLRNSVQAANDVDAGNIDPSNAGFNAKFLAAAAAMGKYGQNRRKLFSVFGNNSSWAILNNASVVTVEKYGQGAAILTGEIGRFMGIPIVVSGKVRESLNASGVYDGVTTNRTHVMICHKDAFAVGLKRDLTIKASDLLYMETDQTVVVATLRKAFKFLYGTDAAINNIFNVALI